jgi:succinate dehydrogenase hydrophobic anchor subunit
MGVNALKDGLRNIMARAWQIILLSALLAAGVGIGSLLTQYQLKMPLNFTLAAQLVAIFFAIMAFGGAVFSIFARRQPAAW